MARYNLSTRLKLANCYLLSPSGVAASTAKYAHNGELFALMSLGKDVSEDTSAGRLILNNCTTVLLAPSKSDKKGELLVVQRLHHKQKNLLLCLIVMDVLHLD